MLLLKKVTCTQLTNHSQKITRSHNSSHNIFFTRSHTNSQKTKNTQELNNKKSPVTGEMWQSVSKCTRPLQVLFKWYFSESLFWEFLWENVINFEANISPEVKDMIFSARFKESQDITTNHNKSQVKKMHDTRFYHENSHNITE